MSIETIDMVGAVAVGVGATFLLDLWTLFLRRAFDVRSLDYCVVGRWLGHMPAGTFRHDSIAAAPTRPGECAIGWIAHYFTGVAFALLLVAPTSGRWLDQPTLPPALLVGIGTVLVPFLVMQPAFGLGIAAARTPNPARARLKSLMTHTVFGLALYAAAALLNYARTPA